MSFWIKKNTPNKTDSGREQENAAARKKKDEKRAQNAKRLDNLRIPHQLPIQVKGIGTRTEYPFLTRDLSSSGAFVVCPDFWNYPFQPSSTILDCAVELRSPNQIEKPRIHFLAKIARVVESAGSEAGVTEGFGIRILQISMEHRHLLENYIGTHGTPDASLQDQRGVNALSERDAGEEPGIASAI
jgi:hypothetical protein